MPSLAVVALRSHDEKSESCERLSVADAPVGRLAHVALPVPPPAVPPPTASVPPSPPPVTIPPAGGIMAALPSLAAGPELRFCFN